MPDEVRREMRVICTELGCRAARIGGADLRRLEWVAAIALEAGLEVWLSPALHDQTTAQGLETIVEVARTARRLTGGPPVGMLTRMRGQPVHARVHPGGDAAGAAGVVAQTVADGRADPAGR